MYLPIYVSTYLLFIIYYYLLFIYLIHFKPLPIYPYILWSVHPFTHPPIISNLFQSIPRYCGLFTHSPTHLSTPLQEANTQTVERAQSLCHILCLLLFLISCHVSCRPAYICSWYTIAVSVLYCLKAHKAENLQL